MNNFLKAGLLTITLTYSLVLASQPSDEIELIDQLSLTKLESMQPLTDREMAETAGKAGPLGAAVGAAGGMAASIATDLSRGNPVNTGSALQAGAAGGAAGFFGNPLLGISAGAGTAFTIGVVRNDALGAPTCNSCHSNK